MCGRYTMFTKRTELEERFDAETLADDFPETYNACPGQYLPIISQKRKIGLFHWGLIPSWAKDASMSSKMINARSETMAEKPSYRRSFKERRCVVPMNGFYEWHKRGTISTPHFIHRPNNEVYFCAGLWESWRRPETDEHVLSFTICTKESNRFMRDLHHRMPVILSDTNCDTWLNPESTADELMELAAAYTPDDYLLEHEVNIAVNSPSNNHPGLIENQDLTLL